jgi:Protein of unknown function, DUF481
MEVLPRPARAVGRVFAAVLSFATLALVSSTAAAQVNAEALRSTLRKHPRFLWLEGSLVGRAGNTETMSFAGSAFGGLTAAPHLFFSRISADYGQARGASTVARWVAHARYNYLLNDVVALEGLVQVQHDRFRRLAVRDLYGAGLRFNIATDDDFEVITGTTYLLEHEVIEEIPGSPTSKDLWHRSSNYVGLNIRVAPLVDASTVTYVQPRFDRPLDFRVLSESYVTFSVTRLLAVRVSASVWYDNRPPFGVRSHDVEVKNSLVLRFD